MATLLALDGNSLFHRAFHAYAPRDGKSAALDSQGRKAWGVMGFISLLASILEKTPHDILMIGFDDSSKSLRREYYPAYKAGRSERDQELHDQLERTVKLLKDLSISVIVAPGLEADDVVASGAHQAPLLGHKSVIVTSDRDSFALINDDTTVMRLLNGGISNAVMMTPQKLVETFGVQGQEYLDYAALRGDKSDNLPGVSGFGEKVAAKLLQTFGSVDAAISAADADPEKVSAVIGAKRLEVLLSEEGRKDFWISKEMMKLKKNIPLAEVFAEKTKASSAQLDEVFKLHGVSVNRKLVLGLAQAKDSSEERVVSEPESSDFKKMASMPPKEPGKAYQPPAERPSEPAGEPAGEPKGEPAEVSSSVSEEAVQEALRLFQIPNPRPERSLLTR